MNKKGFFFLTILLKIIVFIFLIKEFLNKDYPMFFLFLTTLLIFSVSYFFKSKRFFKGIFFFENLCYLLIYVYEFNKLYKNIPYWDTGMHALTGFLSCVLVLFIALYFYKKKKGKIKAFLITFFAFCFSLTIGLLWEESEYIQDMLREKDMQKDMLVDKIITTKFTDDKNPTKIDDIKKTIIFYGDDLKSFTIINGYLDTGINDTMKDLTVNLIGSIMGSLYVYIYLKKDNSMLKS